MYKNEIKTPNDLLNDVVFLFEGGRFIWPGIKINHTITLPLGSEGNSVMLRTINMRPLIFEIENLITLGEVDYLIKTSEPILKRSQVGLHSDKKESDSRTCMSAWLFGNKHVMVDSIKTRVEKIQF